MPKAKEATARKPRSKKTQETAPEAPATVLVLRTCDRNLRSYGGFQYPESGPVSAPDWDPRPSCGAGLHGWLWGEGNGGLMNDDPERKWMVLEVDAASVVDLDSKIKFPSGNVVCCGDQATVTAFLVERAPGKAVIGATVTGGSRAMVTGGYGATVTGGDGGILSLRWWDGKRYRIATFYVGEDDGQGAIVQENTPYRLDQSGKLVEVKR